MPNWAQTPIRKIAATRAANAGATVAQLNAIFGWKGTPRRPTERASPARQLASSLRTTSEHLFPHLDKRCGRKSKTNNDFRSLFFEWWAHKDSNLGPADGSVQILSHI